MNRIVSNVLLTILLIFAGVFIFYLVRNTAWYDFASVKIWLNKNPQFYLLIFTLPAGWLVTQVLTKYLSLSKIILGYSLFITLWYVTLSQGHHEL
jgi:hypothetical protein